MQILIHTHTHMRAHTHTHIYVCMYVCVCVCVCVCFVHLWLKRFSASPRKKSKAEHFCCGNKLILLLN